MHDTYLSVLFSPVSLLFVINAFFMIFVTSFLWKMFFNLKYTQLIINFPSIRDSNSALLKAAFLIPAVSIFLILLVGMREKFTRNLLKLLSFCLMLLTLFLMFIRFLNKEFMNGNLSSPAFKLAIVGLFVSIVGLMLIKRSDKTISSEGVGMFLYLVAYIFMLYGIYLLTLLGTVVTVLNAFPDHFYAPLALAGLFLMHFIFILIVISLKATGQMGLALLYTLMIAFACYSKSLNQSSRDVLPGQSTMPLQSLQQTHQ